MLEYGRSHASGHLVGHLIELQRLAAVIQPELAVAAGCYSLLFGGRCGPEMRISAARSGSLAVFFVHISQNSGGSGFVGEPR